MEKTKKVLITGSGGMLGYALCRRLEADYELFGIDNCDAPDLRLPREDFFKLDITQANAVLGALLKIKPDALIHAASYTDVDACQLNPDKAYAVNYLGTQNLVLAAKEAGAFFVYLSTDYVFDGQKPAAYTEEDTPSPLNIYGDSKLKGEEAIRNSLEKHLIIRTSWLFGPRGKNFVDTILVQGQTKRNLSVVNDQVGSPTYTFDLAMEIKRILSFVFDKGRQKFYPGTYHVTNSGNCSWYGLAKKILELSGMPDIGIEPLTSLQLDRPAPRPKMSILDNSRYSKLTGYNLRHWQDALSEYLALANA